MVSGWKRGVMLDLALGLPVQAGPTLPKQAGWKPGAVGWCLVGVEMLGFLLLCEDLILLRLPPTGKY